MKVKILRGVSGAGKSTYTKSNYPAAKVASADHFFVNENGEYKFDVSKLGEAHQSCFLKFLEYCQAQEDLIVVDNTNTTAAECAPYVLCGEAHGYKVEIITITVDPKLAASRNVHSVPQKTVYQQYKRMMAEKLPSHWKHRMH